MSSLFLARFCAKNVVGDGSWVGLYISTEGLPRRGLQNSAQGFNPGNPQNKRFALKLKGREMRVPDEAMKLAPVAAQKSECAIEACDNWTTEPTSALLGRSIWSPPSASGRLALGGRFPGLKPWAEFCSRCRAQNKGLSPRIVADSPFFGAKSRDRGRRRPRGR